MRDSMPDEDTVPPADPFEAELVAYLDGELDANAARKVEARLAADPQARSRATALKKTFELLDYLPKPEASAEFTSRTLDKIPAFEPSSTKKTQPSPDLSQPQKKSTRASQAAPVLAASRSSSPTLSRPQSILPLLDEPKQSNQWLWVMGILLAESVFATAGYFAGYGLRSNASQTNPSKEATEDLALSDRRIIENLPLY